jgi:uncharacterized protein YcgL (UPF0745 family)
MKCFTYRSSKRDGVYLYVKSPDDLKELPEELLKLLGNPIFMLSFDLYPERKIVKIDSEELISKLNNDGYYLRIDTKDEMDNLLNTDRKNRGLSPVKNEKINN